VNQTYPDAKVTSFELSPVMLFYAQRYFGLESSPNHRVVLGDARYLLNQDSTKYDVIFLDLFHGNQAPEHTQTVEFFKQLRAHLGPAGVLFVNQPVLSTQALHQISALQEAFGGHCYALYLTGDMLLLQLGDGDRPPAPWLSLPDFTRRYRALTDDRAPNPMWVHQPVRLPSILAGSLGTPVDAWDMRL
jgi:hypothetical protein